MQDSGKQSLRSPAPEASPATIEMGFLAPAEGSRGGPGEGPGPGELFGGVAAAAAAAAAAATPTGPQSAAATSAAQQRGGSVNGVGKTPSSTTSSDARGTGALSAMVAATATALKVVHVRTPWAQRLAAAENPALFGRKPRSRRKAVYFRLQGLAYNFLERPTGWACFVYHFTVFVIVLTSLIFSILATIDEYASLAEEVLRPLEITIMIVFGSEYVLRNWGAGCRSKYMGIRGRLRFAVKIMSLFDLAVVVSSLAVIIIGNTGRIFATSAIRVVRFLQILRIVHVDRQGGTWRMLSSVVYIHRQELVTTLYIGFLMLIFSCYIVYLVEKDVVASDGSQPFASFADALWWGIVTVNTVGYGDKVPQSWLGKMVASCLAMSAISFFALPSGILGSGFALKVQQKQRQKHFNRQIPAAASLIQAAWRFYSVSSASSHAATWKMYLRGGNSSGSSSGGGRSKSESQQEQQQGAGRKDTRHVKALATASATAAAAAAASAAAASDGEAGRQGNGAARGGRARSNSSDDRGDGLAHIRGLRKRVEALHQKKGHKRQHHHQQQHHHLDDTDIDMDLGVGDNYVSEKPQRLTDDQKRIVRIIHLVKFHVARKKFQLARKPYDVRDVIEQYSQGHIDMMVRLKELQKRLDTTLGKPSTPAGHATGVTALLLGGEQQRHKHTTVTARLERLEEQVYAVDGKLDQTITILLTLEAMLRGLHRSQRTAAATQEPPSLSWGAAAEAAAGSSRWSDGAVAAARARDASRSSFDSEISDCSSSATTTAVPAAASYASFHGEFGAAAAASGAGGGDHKLRRYSYSAGEM